MKVPLGELLPENLGVCVGWGQGGPSFLPPLTSSSRPEERPRPAAEGDGSV